ncbi:MAG: hypothetical protein RL660_1613, partial [Bacteroidota bacterium]
MNKISISMKALLCMLCFLFSNKVNATHYAAMDIYYEYVSPLVYDVHLIIYYDCNPQSAPPQYQQTMYAQSTSLSQCISFQVDTTGLGLEALDTVTSVCPNIGSQCTNPNSIFIGYKKVHCVGQITLPSTAADWRFVWSTCCRNGAILNLNPAQVGMGVVATLNNIARPVNSSPRLLVDPVPYLCQNQLSQYVNGPFDPDNDSLRFVATPVLENSTCNATDTCTYTVPYWSKQPLPCPSYEVDPTTGTVCFTPTQIGTYVLGFTCYDIDRNNGDTVGSIMRDVQVNIASCFGAPIVNCIPTPDSAEYTICPGTTLCFDDTCTATNTAALLVAKSNNQLVCPGSTFIHPPFSYGSMITAFCWTPSDSDAGPHTLLLEYTDSTCVNAQPILQKIYKIIRINVLNGVSGGGPYNYCLQGDNLVLGASGPSSITSWNWAILPGQALPPGASANFSNPNASSTDASPTTTMYVTVQGLPSIGGCPDKDTVLLNVYPEIVVDAGGPYNPCANDPIQLNLTANQGGGSWAWSPSTFLNSAVVGNPICTPQIPISYNVEYTTVQGCKKTVDVDVTIKGVRPLLSASSEKNPVCVNEPFQLNANAANQPCGISVTPCNSNAPTPINRSIGNDAVLTTNFGPFVRDIQSSYRYQYIYSASELYAAGMRPGTIKSLTFDVVSDNAA